MKKIQRTDKFNMQIARSMAELNSIIADGRSPSGDGRLTVRTIEVAKPAKCNASRIRNLKLST